MQINYMDYINYKNLISSTFLKFGVNGDTDSNIF